MRENDLLLEKAKQGDKTAEDRLVKENMGLVYSAAKRFLNRGYEFEDLTQVGVIGLIKAIRKFDPGFNVQFSTYAVPMILGEIRRFLRDDSMIKVSRSLKETAMKAWRAEEKLRKILGREPLLSEVAKETGESVETLAEALDATAAHESIYETVYSSGGGEITVLDRLKSDSCEEEIINRVMVEEIFEKLDKRERIVLEERYMRGKTQTQIAGMLGVSQVQISRIEKRAIEKLRNEFSAEPV